MRLWVCFSRQDPHPTTTHSQGLEELSNSFPTTDNSCQFCNFSGRLSQVIGRMFSEVSFQTLLMLLQVALRSIESQFFELGNPAPLIVSKLTQHRRFCHPNQLGNFPVGISLTFEIQRFHFSLYARMGMMKPFVMQLFNVLSRKGQLNQGGCESRFLSYFYLFRKPKSTACQSIV